MPFGHGAYSQNGATAGNNGPTAAPITINPMALHLNGPERNSAWNSDMEIDGVNGKATEDSDVNDHKLRKRPNPLPISSMKTGLCYDVRMRYHATVDTTDMHPEDPRRIYEIYKAMCVEGLVDDPEFTGVKKKGDVMHRIDAREVRMDEALMVHSKEHWDFLESTERTSTDRLHQLTAEGDSVYYNNESFFCSRLSCGGAIATCDAVAKGRVKNAIAVIRPPGHHAEPDKAMGFCLFNNVCVAAKVVQKDNENIKKVLILDWDVHHGNGTQKAFYDDPSILYMSIHRYQNGKFYPEGKDGNLDMCGEKDGLGFNVNVPWDMGGMGDGDYMYAFQKVIMPIAIEYNPDLVIVSAGFDAASGDTLGGCFVTPAGYAHMTHMLKSLANGKIVICLEGGYNLLSISHSALAVTKVLCGEPPGKLHDGDVVCDSAVTVIAECISAQSKYWRCMKPKAVPAAMYNTEGSKAHPMNDLVRQFQASKLYQDFHMTPLDIYRDQISQSFTKQVLATEGYMEKQTIVFYVHDPPPVYAEPDPITNRIVLHNARMFDEGCRYAEWAIKNGYGMIDTNIPQALVDVDDSGYTATRQTEEMCLYIWDNYLEISDAKNIILIGAGQAVAGLTHLLVHRDCRERVKATVSIIGEEDPLRAVSANIADEYLPEWYFNNSKIFISSLHSAWERPKIRRKFGDVQKIDFSETHIIIKESFDLATAWMTKQISLS